MITLIGLAVPITFIARRIHDKLSEYVEDMQYENVR